jgi:lysozyme family protein
VALFELAVAETLKWEGGYSSDPNDPGGETRFGISKRDHPNEDIKNLTVDRAKQIYRDGYWKNFYSEIQSQAVATKLFDMGVNIGVGTAVKLLQEALQVPVDGSFGPNTLAATNEHGDAGLDAYKARLVAHYQELVVRNPNLSKFLGGWLRRANS